MPERGGTRRRPAQSVYGSPREWVCIDSTRGEELAEEVRGYFIPDFTNWKIRDDFEQDFARLPDDLKASA